MKLAPKQIFGISTRSEPGAPGAADAGRRTLWRRLWGDRDGSILIMLAIGLPAIVFATGFGIDFSRAENAQTQLNAIADAAALAAVDPSMILQSDSVASAAATAMFNTQAGNVQGVTNVQSAVTISATGGLGGLRTVTVNYTAQSTNLFGGILGLSSLAISGTSAAAASLSPNINFYLVMDKSPSMLLPTTSTGISEVQGATSDACAFACHQQEPGGGYIKDVNGKWVFISDQFYNSGQAGYQTYYLISGSTLYNSAGTQLGTNVSVNTGTTPNTLTYKVSGVTNTVTGFYADGYWLTHNYTSVYPAGSPIDLRVSDETAAAQALIPYAVNEEGINQAVYQIQFYTYDWIHPSASSAVTQYGTMTDVASLSSTAVPNVDSPDWWIQNSEYTTTCCSIGDAVTENYNMLTSMNATMPAPGLGSASSTPQEVMLLITDGVSDEVINGGRVNREFNSTDLGACTAIKRRGIKIAILYTLYAPAVIANDGWSVSNVTPYLPNVLPALQSCASTATNGSPLVYTVQSNQSIAAALQALFQLTIEDAHLVQ